jgi:diacylglycerol O-acyltransferase / wax synthase
MRRMDGLSAFMLEQERTGAYMHTLKISILDASDIPDGWDIRRFRESLARRIHLLPMFRWKFLKVPLGLHHPVWVDDPDFDLDYHVRRIACPTPGDREALCDLISQVYAYQMDLSKPLWMLWVAEGLEDNKVALITLMHHAYTDGTGAARLLHRVYSDTPQDIEPAATPWTPEPVPGQLALLGRALLDLPVTLARCLPRIGKGVVNLRKMKRKYEESGRELPPSVTRDSRDSPFNIMLGKGRTFVFETFDLQDIRSLSKGFGITINDIFVAAAAGAYRNFMISRGFDPDVGPLVTAIPVSKRPPVDEDDCIGNKSSADYLALPVHLNDPMERLRASQHAGNIMKAHIEAAEGLDVSSVLEVTPPALLHLLDWFVKRKEGKFSGIWGNAALSNVAGPREPLYLGRMKMSNWISMGQIFHGLALNSTVWSYAGQFNLCILSDHKLLPNGWELIDHYCEAFAEYAELLDPGEDREGIAARFRGHEHCLVDTPAGSDD